METKLLETLPLRLLVGSMLAAPSAVLRENELLLGTLLVLAREITHAATAAALHLYEIFRKFGLCHRRITRL